MHSGTCSVDDSCYNKVTSLKCGHLMTVTWHIPRLGRWAGRELYGGGVYNSFGSEADCHGSASGFKKVWMLPVLADQSLSWTQTAAGGSDVEKASGWAYVEFNQLARAQWRGKGDLIAQFLLALVIGKTRDALIVKLLDYLIEEKSCPPDLQILNALIVFTTKPALYYVHDWKKPQISSWDHSRKMYLHVPDPTLAIYILDRGATQ